MSIPGSTPFNNVTLETLLQNLKGDEVIYVPNPGNAGDALIAAGTYQLFDRLNLDYKFYKPSECSEYAVKGKTVIYGGGGNLISESKGNACNILLSRVHRHADKVILLPHTVSGNEELLRGLGPNTTLFAREKISYDHIKANTPKANVFLAHDMAFFLDWSEYIKKPGPLNQAPGRRFHDRLKHLKKWVPARIHLMRAYLQNNKCLNCFRTDKEQTDLELPGDNLDLSLKLKQGPLSPFIAHAVTRQMLRYLSLFPTIKTNRLHVCIGAALIGKKVVFYPNNYYKNCAVYEHSIKDRFPNVTWRENGRTD